MNKLISQGAEAKIYLTENNKAEQIVNKQRIPKGYRHPQLDKQIRTRRTKSETKILTKALALNINVPKVLNVNQEPKTKNQKQFEIHLEFIPGDRLSETLNDYDEKKQFKTMQQLGKQVALLHTNNIIHGDLTTSNVILQLPTTNYKLPTTKSKIYIIDFGLSFVSTKQEDKAVDLHLIKQALEAKHFQNHKDLFEAFKKGYKWEETEKILERLIVVEKRGRYKH